MRCKLGIAVLSASSLAVAQSGSQKLALVIPTLYGPQGLTLPSTTHNAHFERSRIQESFTPLNGAVASQVAQLPLASPASGFIYTFDRSLGVYNRSSQSLGPVITERAETIGRGRLFFAATYQFFHFTSADGIDLSNIPAILHHEVTPSAFAADYITTNNSIDLKIHQVTAFATVGVTNRFDLSLAAPIVNARLGVISDARIQRVASPDPVRGQAHFFDPNDPNGSTRKVFSGASTASGLGDLTFRGKWTAIAGETAALALAFDLRTPTGDEMNFLGSGAWGFRPFLVVSGYRGRFAPHANIGYQWNGDSVLAGNDIAGGAKGHLPNSFSYALGADIGASRRVTFAADFLGERVFKGQRLFRASQTDPLNRVFAETRLRTESYNLLSGSTGAKVNIARQVLLTANVIFRLNDAGLKANVVPLVGLSYSF